MNGRVVGAFQGLQSASLANAVGLCARDLKTIHINAHYLLCCAMWHARQHGVAHQTMHFLSEAYSLAIALIMRPLRRGRQQG